MKLPAIISSLLLPLLVGAANNSASVAQTETHDTYDVASPHRANNLRGRQMADGDEDLGFMWALWYDDDIKWAPRGYSFCVMCRNQECKKDDYVVTSNCNNNLPHYRWEWVKVGEGRGLMKTKTKNLCLEGDGGQFLLRRCDKGNDGQHFEGIEFGGDKFRLYSSTRQKGKERCMTMLHHPLSKGGDDGEEIIDQPCSKAEKTDTVYWTAEYRLQIKDTLKRCRGGNKCEECEECEDDDDCKGNLVCYNRGGDGWRVNLKNKADPDGWAQIPGCPGYGKYGKNYCSRKQYESPYSNKDINDILN
mmetsp:Transcript_27928/g.56539  ORF Transcript_27928/g.56539 Transcript_27928/m.56539 type:complete len:304 (-) Transcript_27928:1565-2476(-)